LGIWASNIQYVMLNASRRTLSECKILNYNFTTAFKQRQEITTVLNVNEGITVWSTTTATQHERSHMA